MTHQNSLDALHQREYKVIKRDLVRLVLLNAVYLVGILALYFANQKSHFLDNWFAALFRF